MNIPWRVNTRTIFSTRSSPSFHLNFTTKLGTDHNLLSSEEQTRKGATRTQRRGSVNMTNSKDFTFLADTPLSSTLPPVPDSTWSSAPPGISPGKLQLKIQAIRKADWKLSWKQAEAIALDEMQNLKASDTKEKKADDEEKGKAEPQREPEQQEKLMLMQQSNPQQRSKPRSKLKPESKPLHGRRRKLRQISRPKRK